MAQTETAVQTENLPSVEHTMRCNIFHLLSGAEDVFLSSLIIGLLPLEGLFPIIE